MTARFPFTRVRRGWFFECRWFVLRVYPPTLGSFTFMRKRR